jgi:aldehyde dehydrogenase (NAD+)
MDMMSMEEVFNQQQQLFASQKTKNLDFRRTQLAKLMQLIEQYEKDCYSAIEQDFGKSGFETFLTEITIIKKDIKYYAKHLKRLASPQKVKTNLLNLPGSSSIYKEPLGVVLVIGAWNYPFQLSISPAVAALAAGNCCIIKPSELPANTMKVLAKMINANFDASILHVVEGGVEVTSQLLQLKFDKIFFTGSPKVGKIVYEAAAKQLIPVTLELGGKSPVIVTQNSNVAIAAKRIVWAKFLNAGQTCVAPDYVMVHQSQREKLIFKLKEYIAKFEYSHNSDNYTRIINKKNFDRLADLLKGQKIIEGGIMDAAHLYISPTLVSTEDWHSALMQDEIFGPILPILTYENYEETLALIASKEKPLSAYLFSDDKLEQEKFLNNLSFGGGCINDLIVHLANENLPFGGVGQSGFGSYHGEEGFYTFSHRKSILHRKTWGEPDLKYPPYNEGKKKWIKRLL